MCFFFLQSPIQVLSCRCRPYSLPAYASEDPLNPSSDTSSTTETDSHQDQMASSKCHCEDEYERMRQSCRLVSRFSRNKPSMFGEEVLETDENAPEGVIQTGGISSDMNKGISELTPTSVIIEDRGSNAEASCSSTSRPSPPYVFPTHPCDRLNDETNLLEPHSNPKPKIIGQVPLLLSTSKAVDNGESQST